MKIVDKIADLLDLLHKGKNSIKQWYLREKTQKILLIIMFAFAIIMVIHNFYQASLPLHFILIFIAIALFSILILLGEIKRKKRKISNLKKKPTPKVKLQNFDLRISKNKLERILYHLFRHNIIDESIVKESTFINVWLLDFKNSDAIILNNEYAQSKYLLEKFIKVDALIKENSLQETNVLTLKDLCDSKKFVRNGKPLNQKQLISNYSDAKKNNPTKLLEFQDLIDEIFTNALDI